MSTINKKNLMVWAIVILAVMSLSTLATILYHQYQSRKITVNDASVEMMKVNSSEKFTGRYFRDFLNLSSEQMNQFKEFNPVFRKQACSITVELAHKRKLMLEEMTALKSDTTVLNLLSDSIGILHSNLKKLTYRYYLDLKGICDNQQKQKLEILFKEMFTNDAPMTFPGRGGMQMMQHGKRNNN